MKQNVRIAKAVDRRNVGVMFHLHYWQAGPEREPLHCVIATGAS